MDDGFVIFSSMSSPWGWTKWTLLGLPPAGPICPRNWGPYLQTGDIFIGKTKKHPRMEWGTMGYQCASQWVPYLQTDHFLSNWDIFNRNFSILKWRYVSTIFLAKKNYWDIPWNLTLYMVGTSNKSVPEWPLIFRMVLPHWTPAMHRRLWGDGWLLQFQPGLSVPRPVAHHHKSFLICIYICIDIIVIVIVIYIYTHVNNPYIYIIFTCYNLCCSQVARAIFLQFCRLHLPWTHQAAWLWFDAHSMWVHRYVEHFRICSEIYLSIYHHLSICPSIHPSTCLIQSNLILSQLYLSIYLCLSLSPCQYYI